LAGTLKQGELFTEDPFAPAADKLREAAEKLAKVLPSTEEQLEGAKRLIEEFRKGNEGFAQELVDTSFTPEDKAWMFGEDIMGYIDVRKIPPDCMRHFGEMMSKGLREIRRRVFETQGKVLLELGFTEEVVAKMRSQL